MGDLLETLANWAQIISIPLAIIAIALSIWLYRRGRQRRAISCIFDPLIAPIEIKAGDALRGEIEIRYRGQPVGNLFMVRATLRNTGNLPIRKADMVEPLTFTLGSGSEFIRQPQILNKKPSNLEVNWELSGSNTTTEMTIAQLAFELLNPGEGLTVEFLCTGKSGVPELTARIEGVTQIDIVDSLETHLRNQMREAPIVGGIAVVFGFFLSIFLKVGSPWELHLLMGLFAGAFAVLMRGLLPLIALIRHRRSKSLRS